MNESYYPAAQGDQIDWNTNIIDQLPALATELSIAPAELTSILNDCAFQVFLLSKVDQMARSTFAALHGFTKAMDRSPLNSPAIAMPTLPTWPVDAPALVLPGIGARRSAWVAKAKKSNGYNKDTNGRTLRLEPTVTPFDPSTYVAQLKSLKAVGHEQVLVTVRKGGGEVTMLKLLMRLKGQGDFRQVGMFTSRTYFDNTPLAQPNVPEEREYQLIAMKKDAPIGQPSPIMSVMVG
jgi:hypothetical protein